MGNVGGGGGWDIAPMMFRLNFKEGKQVKWDYPPTTTAEPPPPPLHRTRPTLENTLPPPLLMFVYNISNSSPYIPEAVLFGKQKKKK